MKSNMHFTIQLFRATLTKMSKYEVVMIRHGESEWNQKNLFCGWFDSDLSDAGRAEAEAAGKALKGGFVYFITFFILHLIITTDSKRLNT